MKNLVIKYVKKMLMWRSRKKNLSHLKKLKQHSLIFKGDKKYPTKLNDPLISKYDFFKNSDLKWLDFYYAIYGKSDPLFLSIPVYYYVETCLNHRVLTYAIKEKNFLNKFMPSIPTPVTIFRRINGIYYSSEFKKIEISEIQSFLSNYNKIILKPSIESGGGTSIHVFKREDNASKFFNGKQTLDKRFLDSYGKDFVVQEYVEQHNYFSRFNETSNNTIRVFIYRSVIDDSINILHCLLRIGAKGSFLDHDHLGGIVLSIDEHNKISPYALDIYGNKYMSVNNIGFSSQGTVPAMKQIRNLSKKMAEKIYYGRLLALDFTVNRQEEPLALEINCWRNGISQYQMHNGGLFKEFTEEILDYCQNITLPVTLQL